MSDTTTILASGPNWTLRRDDPDHAAVLEIRNAYGTILVTPDGALHAVTVPPDLAALLTDAPRWKQALLDISAFYRTRGEFTTGCKLAENAIMPESLAHVAAVTDAMGRHLEALDDEPAPYDAPCFGPERIGGPD